MNSQDRKHLLYGVINCRLFVVTRPTKCYYVDHSPWDTRMTLLCKMSLCKAVCQNQILWRQHFILHRQQHRALLSDLYWEHEGKEYLLLPLLLLVKTERCESRTLNQETQVPTPQLTLENPLTILYWHFNFHISIM